MADDDAWRPHSVHVLELSEGAVASIVAFVGPLGPHAATERLALLTRDVSRYRTYYPSVQLIIPNREA